MRWKAFVVYISIIKVNRPSAFIYLCLNSLVDLCRNLTLLFLPAVFLNVLIDLKEIDKLVFTVLVLIVASMLKKYTSVVITIEKEVQDQIMIMAIIEKMNMIPYEYLERADIKEKKQSCIFAIQNYGAVYDLYSNIIEFITATFTLISIILIFFQLGIFYVGVVIICSMATMILNQLLMNEKKKYSDKTVKLNFLYGYFQEIANQKKYQISNRMYNYSKVVNHQIKNLNKETDEHFSRMRNTEAFYLSLITCFENIQKIFSYLIPAMKYISNKILLAELTLLINCGLNMSIVMNRLISSYQSFMQSLDYLVPIYEIFKIADECRVEHKKFSGIIETLVFDEVTFRYEKSDVDVLKNLSFVINKNENVGILGANGVGKTTILKLILKLYQPSSGRILVNGVDIRYYDESYIKAISVVFQDSKLFPISLKENIVATSVDNEGFEMFLEVLGINQIIRQKQIHLDDLCNSEVFENGLEFSGGEKQLISIARALYRNANLMLLDEPSSSLDPIMTNRVIEKFYQLMEKHTTILITHDIVLANKCDRIIFIKNESVQFLSHVDEEIFYM